MSDLTFDSIIHNIQVYQNISRKGWNPVLKFPLYKGPTFGLQTIFYAETKLINTGLGNETGKFQNIKKIDTWIFYLFIGYKWKAYE